MDGLERSLCTMNKRIKYLHKNILLFRQSYRFLVEISFISQIQILKYPFRIDHILKIKEFLIGEGGGGRVILYTEVIRKLTGLF